MARHNFEVINVVNLNILQSLARERVIFQVFVLTLNEFVIGRSLKDLYLILILLIKDQL